MYQYFVGETHDFVILHYNVGLGLETIMPGMFSAFITSIHLCILKFIEVYLTLLFM